jgi:hypothetical protein
MPGECGTRGQPLLFITLNILRFFYFAGASPRFAQWPARRPEQAISSAWVFSADTSRPIFGANVESAFRMLGAPAVVDVAGDAMRDDARREKIVQVDRLSLTRPSRRLPKKTNAASAIATQTTVIRRVPDRSRLDRGQPIAREPVQHVKPWPTCPPPYPTRSPRGRTRRVSPRSVPPCVGPQQFKHRRIVCAAIAREVCPHISSSRTYDDSGHKLFQGERLSDRPRSERTKPGSGGLSPSSLSDLASSKFLSL